MSIKLQWITSSHTHNVHIKQMVFNYLMEKTNVSKKKCLFVNYSQLSSTSQENGSYLVLILWPLYINLILIKMKIVDDPNVVASKNINIFPGIVSRKETPVSCVENVPVDLFSWYYWICIWNHFKYEVWKRNWRTNTFLWWLCGFFAFISMATRETGKQEERGGMTFSKAPGWNQAQAAAVRTQLWVHGVYTQACELPEYLSILYIW